MTWNVGAPPYDPLMDVLTGMTPLELDLPEPPLAWWTVTLEVPRDGDVPLVDPGVRLPAALELRLLADQSVLSLRVPAVDEVAAIVAAAQVVRVLLGRWPGLLSAGVRRAGQAGGDQPHGTPARASSSC